MWLVFPMIIPRKRAGVDSPFPHRDKLIKFSTEEMKIVFAWSFVRVIK